MFKTILEGQQALVLNHLGEGKIVKGPARVSIFMKIDCKKLNLSGMQIR